MTWLILGIILFLIEYIVLKNSTYFQYVKVSNNSYYGYKYEKTEENPVRVKLWWVLLLLIGNLPILSLITFIVFWCIWGMKAGDEGDRSPEKSYWRLHSKTMSKIVAFFNKEV